MNLTLNQLKDIVSESYSYYNYHVTNFTTFDIISDFTHINSLLNKIQQYLDTFKIQYNMPVDVTGHVTYHIAKNCLYVITFDNFYLTVEYLKNETVIKVVPVCYNKKSYRKNSFFQKNDNEGYDLIVPNIKVEINGDAIDVLTSYTLLGKLHNKFGVASKNYSFYKDEDGADKLQVDERYFLNGSQFTKLEWLKITNAPEDSILNHLKTENTIFDIRCTEVKLHKAIKNLEEITVEIVKGEKLQIHYNGAMYNIEAMSNCGKFLKLRMNEIPNQSET